MTNDKKYLLLVNLFMQVIFAFFDIFFSIYIYDIANDLVFVFCYLIWQCLIIIIFEYFVMKILNSKNYLIIYRLGFIMTLISIALIFTISNSTLFMVYVVQTVYSIALIFFYMPHEVSIMNTNTRNSMSSFVGIHQVLSLIAGVLSPFLSGFVIDFISYPALFIFIIFLSLVCFLFSLKIKNGVYDEPKISLKKFYTDARKIKPVLLSYYSHAFEKASNGAITILLPLLLYMKISTNFSVGIYSALATAISGIVLLLITKYYKPASTYLIISTIVAILSSIIIIIWSSIEIFLIYYFFGSIARKVIAKYDAEMVYSVLSETEIAPYKKEHHFVFNFYDQGSRIISYIFSILVIIYLKSVLTLSILVFTLSVLQIFATLFLIKSNSEYDKYIQAKKVVS